MNLVWAVIPLILIGIVGMEESFAEKFSLETFEFILQGGSLIGIEDDSRANSIILRVEMDTDGNVIVSKTHHISANSDCTPTNDLFVLIDGEEVGYDIDKNDYSLTIQIPKESKAIEIISSHILVLHTTSSMYAEFCKTLDDGKYMNPYAQTKIGFLVDDIICKENLVLIFNEFSNKPVCVKSNNVEKLLDRGYSTQRLFTLPFSTMYELNDSNNSIIRYHLYDSNLESISEIDNGIRFHIISNTSGMISVSIPREIMTNTSMGTPELNSKNCGSNDNIRSTNTSRGHGGYSFSTTSTHIMYLYLFHDDTQYVDFFCN